MWVIKTTGEKEEFQPEKIKLTCLKAGAPLELANKIAKEVKKRVYNGISTRKILALTLKYLEKEEPIVATRYDLKNAIIRLGPAGFAFERLIREILEAYDYKVEMPDILYGACVDHEVDLVATKEKCYMVECKYHNAPGIYSGVKDALYIYARFLDLRDGFKKGKCPIKFDQPFLICNTRFSDDALQYAFCKRMKMISWKYPKNRGLRELLENQRLYPITVLRKMNNFVQKRLAREGIMLCRNLIKMDFNKLRRITGLRKKDLNDLLEEARSIVKF